MCFKIYTDIMTQYIADSRVYRPPSNAVSAGNEGEFVGESSSNAIDVVILQSLMPKLMHILTTCQSPIPMFGLRLLCSIVEANPSLIK
jgi:hypothetical protein